MNLSLDQLLEAKPPVLPIWRAGSSKDPECVGTGWLALFDGQCYLISAAHVFENVLPNDCYVFAVDAFEPLEKTPFALSALTETFRTRDDDPFDIGAVLLPDNIINRVNGRAVFITPDMISDKPLLSDNTLYRVLGFPSGKNERMWERYQHGGKQFQTNVYQIKTTDIGSTFFPRTPFLSEWHLPLDFNQNEVLDAHGKKFKPPDMHGISGGLVIAEGENDIRPEAVVIQKDVEKSALVSVKITKVFEWLAHHAAAMRKR
jgi:hypothetical protein